ncbi:hypothetical protein E2C01_081053 [Portunus trituberculatus]|uniref:Uncharacterized protein n=1 Tax=Portunus trituberculatus TaxID=210409 RepID=A0A5B7IQY6_PORTR|nr:hypothetical protein [Portunus trituberculatus]
MCRQSEKGEGSAKELLEAATVKQQITLVSENLLNRWQMSMYTSIHDNLWKQHEGEEIPEAAFLKSCSSISLPHTNTSLFLNE